MEVSKSTSATSNFSSLALKYDQKVANVSQRLPPRREKKVSFCWY